ncbi:calponin homology domain-containing protein DDB_G0272472-like isoform X2 [Photinus pyralis]|uniref:calponin homology domain-containing protein DDB_G0272472-like isoform X2 n=1 Tax=Photinus pyralis TaxID=7054 RepID=UPI001266F800|nr:calponin homology domain-containing protein DDB_G0272472-like isoform X2 [Photinus pyralis]
METRWYLKPGDTLETTKINERGHALHATADAWKNLTAHLDRNRLIQESIERERAHKEALKKGSLEMTAKWDNSVENIRKRKEEERTTRLEKEESDKMERFFKIRAEQEGIRQQYISDARRRIYLTKEHPKALTSALILSEVIYEREKQLEFDKKIKQHEEEELAKRTQKIKEDAIKEVEENKAKEKKIREKNSELGKEYLRHIIGNENSAKLLKQQSIDRERVDIANMEKEFAHIKRVEAEEVQMKKDSIKKEFLDFGIAQARAKEIMEQEDKEQENIINIYAQAKHGIECLRQKKVKEMQQAMVLRREAASKKAVAEAKAKGENEERILKQAAEEVEKRELEQLKLKEQTRRQLIKDRQEDRERFLKREEERKREEAEVIKWEMLNRFKKNDVMEAYNKAKEKERWDGKLAYRRILMDQIVG